MNKPRHVLLLVLLCFASALSCTFIVHTAGLMSPPSAILITILPLGGSAVLRLLIVMKPPISLRQVRSWECNGGLYRALGVPRFGTFLRRTPLHHLNSTVYLRSSHGDIATVRAQMEASEAAHLWAMLLTMPYVLYAIFQRRWSAMLWSIVFNLAFNVYPILHLRFARGRLIALSTRQPGPPKSER